MYYKTWSAWYSTSNTFLGMPFWICMWSCIWPEMNLGLYLQGCVYVDESIYASKQVNSVLLCVRHVQCHPCRLYASGCQRIISINPTMQLHPIMHSELRKKLRLDLSYTLLPMIQYLCSKMSEDDKDKSHNANVSHNALWLKLFF